MLPMRVVQPAMFVVAAMEPVLARLVPVMIAMVGVMVVVMMMLMVLFSPLRTGNRRGQERHCNRPHDQNPG